MKRWEQVVVIVVLFLGLCSITPPVHAAEKTGISETSATLSQVARQKRPPLEVMTWLKARIGNFPPPQRDALVSAVVDYQKSRLQDYQKEFESCEATEEKTIDAGYRHSSLDTLNLILGIRDGNLKSTLARLRENGYRVNHCEDFLYVELDFRVPLNIFLADISDELKEFLLIQACEAEAKSYDDAGRIISYDELASRLEVTSEFQKRYPKSIFLRNVRLYEALYMALYLGYAVNTPVFEKQEGSDEAVISPVALESYRDAASWEETSAFGKAMKELVAMLDEREGRKTNAIEEYMNDHAALGCWLLKDIYESNCWWDLRADLVDEWAREQARNRQAQ